MKAMLVAISLLLASAVAQTQSNPAKLGAKSGAALEAKVRAVWENFQKKNKPAVDKLLDPEFRSIEDGDSEFTNKATELKQVDEYTLDNYKLSDFQTTTIGPNASLVTYKAEFSGKASGQPVHMRGVFGEVWVKRSGEWKCLYSQETAFH
jgi:hypothetical protein